MLTSLITTVLLATSVLAAPSAQPGYKQTSRQAVTDRLNNRAKGIVRRQAASPRPYSLCDPSGPPGEGALFARYDGSIYPGSGTSGMNFPGTSLDDCMNKCAGLFDCRAVFLVGQQCNALSQYGDLVTSSYTYSFDGIDCASLAAQYPGIASAKCCNYWTPSSPTPLD